MLETSSLSVSNYAMSVSIKIHTHTQTFACGLLSRMWSLDYYFIIIISPKPDRWYGKRYTVADKMCVGTPTPCSMQSEEEK